MHVEVYKGCVVIWMLKCTRIVLLCGCLSVPGLCCYVDVEMHDDCVVTWMLKCTMIVLLH